MNKVNTILNDLPVNDLNLYIELGNRAGRCGNLEESMQWYIKGLTKARELNDKTKINLLSSLIALSL